MAFFCVDLLELGPLIVTLDCHLWLISLIAILGCDPWCAIPGHHPWLLLLIVFFDCWPWHPPLAVILILTLGCHPLTCCDLLDGCFHWVSSSPIPVEFYHLFTSVIVILGLAFPLNWSPWLLSLLVILDWHPSWSLSLIAIVGCFPWLLALMFLWLTAILDCYPWLTFLMANSFDVVLIIWVSSMMLFLAC